VFIRVCEPPVVLLFELVRRSAWRGIPSEPEIGDETLTFPVTSIAECFPCR
jgi:hypothetical protein